MLDCCIDVSDNDSIQSWPRIYAPGIRVAFVKAMQGAGPTYSTWKPQCEGAQAAGIVVIPYLFLTRGPAVSDVIKNFVAEASLAKGKHFALDWEGRASQTCTPADAEAIGLGIAAQMKSVPIGYWGESGSTPAQPTIKMQAWDRWIPRYPQVPQPASLAVMRPAGLTKVPPGAKWWQYTSAGRVDGITGPVDRSAWIGTEAELEAWLT